MDLKIADIILGLLQLREYNPKIDQQMGVLIRSNNKYNIEILAQILVVLDILNLIEEGSEVDTIEDLLVDKELQIYFKVLNLIQNIPRKALEEL